MDLKQQILHLYRVDELSLREIARRTGADRKTVTRLINAYEAAVKADPDTGIDEFLATRPKYTSRKYAPRVMRDAVAKEIDRCLKENDRRRGNGMRKQCLKNTDIHRQLMEKGLAVSYSGVCKYVRKKKSERASKGRDVYLRIHKAGFPQMKYLAELVREDLPVDGRNLLPEFETLDFIRAGRNIVMYGNPGTGKTHIAIGLNGLCQLRQGRSGTVVQHDIDKNRRQSHDHNDQSSFHALGGNHQGQGPLLRPG